MKSGQGVPMTKTGALEIDENTFGNDHPDLIKDLSILISILQITNRYVEAEPLCRRQVELSMKFTSTTGQEHPHLKLSIYTYARLLSNLGWSEKVIANQLKKLASEF